jgi:protein-S-isoprenylcysteine O-methyltransferase Ste14
MIAMNNFSITPNQAALKLLALVLSIYFRFAFGTIFLAGLDGGRYRWSGELPNLRIVLAYLIYLLGNSLAGWTINSNPFFSFESRLQIDRNQMVSNRGPYRFICHPAYLATLLFWSVTGLMLESYWAVIPGLLAGFLTVVRTGYEDRMLMADLPGYTEYAQQVRYRLIPGIW